MWVPRCDEAGHLLEGLLMMTKLVAAKASILMSMNSRPGWLNSASHFTAYLRIYVAMLFLLCEGHRCIFWPTLYASQLYSREASGTARLLPHVASSAIKPCHSRMHSASPAVRMRDFGCLLQLRKFLFFSIIFAFSCLHILLLKDGRK